MSRKSAGAAAESAARPFLSWYESLPFEQRLAIEDSFKEVVKAAEDHAAAATFSLTVAVASKGKRRVTILPKISTKLPRTKLEATAAWVTPSGDLSESDPQQQDLPLVSMTKQELPLASITPLRRDE